jgi:primosomal protein N' (replication factor Y) (superfamily II helicase)
VKPSLEKPYAEVTFNLPIKEVFTYKIPPKFFGKIQVGMRAFVPFGRRRITGYVVALAEKWEKDIKLKSISDLPDTKPMIGKEILTLTKWLSNYYQCSWGEAIRAALPAGFDDENREEFSLTEMGTDALLKDSLSKSATLLLHFIGEHPKVTSKQCQKGLGKKFSAHSLANLKQDGLLASTETIHKSTVGYQFIKTARLKSDLPEPVEIEQLLKRSPKQKQVYDCLIQGAIGTIDLEKKVKGSAAILRSLKDKGLVETFLKKVERTSHVDTSNQPIGPSLKFTPEQKKVFVELNAAIQDTKFQTFLLHGVTGSGKTEIYIRCIQQVLEQGKAAIMMVPEISLTPQTVARFRQRFGDRVAILHSGLSQKERFIEWKKIYDKQVSIAIGARSAIFAPFENLGIIVIDEEHDGSYKQESTPRYHARDTAVIRARSQNAVVLLGSATPSLESIHNTQLDKYKYLSLEKRVGERMLPIASLVDMREERKEFKNFSILSGQLIAAIRDRLSRKEQIFLFLNRRGTARFVYCPDCGYVVECNHCSVTMTFHGNEDKLLCHYCSFSAPMPGHCIECQSEVIRFSGFGTQKLEEETIKLFPKAKIRRLDRDTTQSKSAFVNMHRDMQSGEIDILIGTQMITKGHDFHNVTLVGVVAADVALNIPDFRSCERAFQLLIQVAGRAGRGKVPGKVIIQTNNPDHYMFEFVIEHDVKAFHNKELKLRKRLNYPPYTKMIALEVVCENEMQGQNAIGKLRQSLSRLVSREKFVELIGPSKAALYRIQNKFRWHLLLRSGNMKQLQKILLKCSELNELKAFGKIKLSIDVDPLNLL